MSGARPAMARRRSAGYRLFGTGFDYLLHLRPAEWPVVAAHVATGTLLAAGLGGLGSLDHRRVLIGIVLWVVCLNGGTLAINSAFDRDTGDIAYLRSPPPPPRHLFTFGVALMVFGLGVATALPPGFRVAYAICLVLSILYSVPPFRLKAVAGLDWFINMWGFGALTAYAGWAATGIAVDPGGRAVLLGFCPLFAALYPLTQLYQIEEDRARGDRTLALVLGPVGSLAAATGAAGLAFAVFRWAGHLRGWALQPDGAFRAGALLVAAAAWAAVLLPWAGRAARLSPARHQRGMYLALAAWALTDAVVIFAFAR